MDRKSIQSEPKVLGQEDIKIEDWHHFVKNCPSASIYHLPEWTRILKNSFGYKSFNLFSIDQEGRLCGMLPLSLVNSHLTGSRLVSLPFSHIAGPISVSNSSMEPLIKKAKRLSQILKCDYLEIRVMDNQAQDKADSIWLQNGFEISDQFSTYVLELSQPEVVWTKLDSKSVRWAIRKAQRDGVTVRKAGSVGDIKRFYVLNLKTKRRLGVPGHPERLFLEIFREMGTRCQLYFAEFQNKIIAGIVTIEFNSIVLYWYAAYEISYRMHQPNYLLLWTAIEESCRKGYKFFDFGRVSSAEQGLAAFKRHWGTKEKKLDYYFYPRIPKSMALNPHGTKLKLANSIWRKMPLPLARIGSNIIFRHLG